MADDIGRSKGLGPDKAIISTTGRPTRHDRPVCHGREDIWKEATVEVAVDVNIGDMTMGGDCHGPRQGQ